ncbi:CopD family protein [Gordonia araii]|uniref:CopD family protein n=1 Tax=Gordonia araii TaxID=263909 RepID=UPI000A00D4DB|nr:CopD family protein [Gordonia araii]NNG96439.1 copper resistance protein CopD [Gordonia araii NBRC 100433]
MAGRDAASGSRRSAALLALGLVAVVIGVGLAVALAGTAGPTASAWAHGVALAASVFLLGLGSLTLLGVDPSSRTVGVTASVWLVAEVAAMWLTTADRLGASPSQVSVGDYLRAWSAQPADLIAVLCAAACALWAIGRLAGWHDIAATVVAGLAGIGLVAVAVSGHASTDALGPVVVGVHAAAAAWWCGTLAAMAVSIRGRAGWAGALPRYSGLALWAVAALTVSGVVAALVRLDVLGAQGISAVWSSGYGRVVVAKALALALLIGIAALHRRRWVPRAGSHRMSHVDSVKHASAEIAVMAVALGLAAGLAGTAPPG